MSDTTTQVSESSGQVINNTGAVGSKDSSKTKEQPKQEAAPANSSTLIEQLKKLGDRAALNAIDGINQYIDAMKPGKAVNPTEGAHQQVVLYRTLQNIINGEQPNFKLLFATVLKIIDENSKTVFSGTHIFRFIDQVVLNAEDRQAFLRIVNLLMTGAAVEGRQSAMRHVDFQRSLQYGVTEEGRVRIHSFFNR